MKVAILNREPSSHPGGDLVAIRELTRALGRVGVESTYLRGNWWPAHLVAFDLVHIFHCNFGWSRENFEKTLKSGKPYVVTPVFYPTNELGMTYPDIYHYMSKAKGVMPFSEVEATELAKVVGPMRQHVIPNGTSKIFHRPLGNVESTSARTGVLTVAARSGDKNTDKVEQACKELGIPFSCAMIVPHAQMPEVYEKAKVFVNASGSERMSLTIGEALCAGCRVMATKHNRGNEWYGEGLMQMDPDDYPALLTWLEWAYTNDEWDWEPNKLAQELTWEHVARQVVGVYREALR